MYFNLVCFDNSLILPARYDPSGDSYHEDIEGDGVICLAVDILPTEFAKEVLYVFALSPSSLLCLLRYIVIIVFGEYYLNSIFKR